MTYSNTFNFHNYKKWNEQSQPAPTRRFAGRIISILLMALSVLMPAAGRTADGITGQESGATAGPSLDKILENIEQRYAVAGFTADFIQESTLKMMQITDYASGKAAFQRPGMMRWEYEAPERQLIITDGRQLWIYKPDDKQVMIGKSASLFADGSGAGFLSNIKLLREKFDIVLMPPPDDSHFALKLTPKDKTVDLAYVTIKVLKQTHTVVQITSYNAYGDETRIKLTHIQFNQKPDTDRFRFNIPDDVDLLYLDE